MRRIDKERIELFKKMGLYDLFCETREKPKVVIIAEYMEIITKPLYKNGSDLIKMVINNFYGMAIDYAWGKEKRLAGQQVFGNRGAV